MVHDPFKAMRPQGLARLRALLRAVIRPTTTPPPERPWSGRHLAAVIDGCDLVLRGGQVMLRRTKTQDHIRLQMQVNGTAFCSRFHRSRL